MALFGDCSSLKVEGAAGCLMVCHHQPGHSSILYFAHLMGLRCRCPRSSHLPRCKLEVWAGWGWVRRVVERAPGLCKMLPQGLELESPAVRPRLNLGPVCWLLLILDVVGGAGERRARQAVRRHSWEWLYLCPFQHVGFVNRPGSRLPCFVSAAIARPWSHRLFCQRHLFMCRLESQ